MGNSKNNFIVRELNYILLSILINLFIVLGYGVLLDNWLKSPLEIGKLNLYVYGGLIVIRLFGWIYKKI